MRFLKSIWQRIGSGLRPIASAAACLQEILFFNELLNAMPVRFFSSAIAPSYFPSRFNKEMTKDDAARFIRLPVSRWVVVLLCMLFIPVNAGAVVINNTVSVTSNAGMLNASVDVVSIFNTVSSIELLQYAPGPVSGSSPVAVATTSFSTTGLPAGPFAPSANPVDVSSAPIAMPGTVDLLPASAYKSGEPIFIRLSDADQNANSTLSEAVLVTVTTPVTGDSVVLRLSETGPNTGVFVGYVQSSNAPVTVNDDAISVGINEMINVNYVDASDGTDVSTDAALVDPYGTVFSTVDGSPLDGATVTLIDVGTGLPATVLGDDGVSIFPSAVTSGGSVTDSSGNTYNFPAGSYRFPYVVPGTYRLDVIPPAGYSGPSTVPAATIQTLPGAPFAIVSGSRNENFVVNPGPALQIDIPLDSSASGLFITKKAVKNSVAVGEFMQYQLELSNTAAVALTNTRIVDVLPVGFRYESGSAKVDGARVANPAVTSDGRTLTFSIGDLPVATKKSLRYVVAVGAGTTSGDAVNRAHGTADGGIVSNTAQASVKVIDELMPSRSHLMGRVIFGGCDASVGKAGDVSIQLQSEGNNDYIDYRATVKVDTVTVNGLSTIITLPGTLEYVSGSALRDRIHLIDPEIKGNQLIFNLDRVAAGTTTMISFRTRSKLNAFGEFYIRAYAEFEDPDSEEDEIVLQRTPIVLNKIKDFSRILRPRFDSLSAKLKPADLRDMDDLIQSLRGQEIERIHIIGHTDKQPIRARSRSIFASNEELSYARAKSVADYMKKTLKLQDEQIKITGMGARKQLIYSERLSQQALTTSQQLSVNRRVEVLVQLKGQGKKSRFIISQGNSGTKVIETIGPKGEMKEPGLADNYPGLGNVRLYLEDGRYVDTDEKGLYHFEGLTPGTHVVQLDVDSLPDYMEVYSCEKNTRFAGTPQSQFVDLQGGSLWRSDFYVRTKPTSSLKGDVGLQLNSKLVNGELHYRVLFNAKGLTINQRRLLVDMPYGTQYVQGSSLLDGKPFADPELKQGQLVFDLGNAEGKSWQKELLFRAIQVNMSEGEFSTLAVLDYRTADGKSRQSSAVVNTLVRQAENIHKSIFLGNYQESETGLSDRDQQRLEGAIDYLRGKTIREVEVISTTENQKIPKKLRELYPGNKALAQARADLIGSHIVDSLNLFEDQVKRVAHAVDPSIENTDKNTSQPVNNQVEIFVTLANEQAPKDIRLKESDSGMVNNTIIGVIPKQEIADEEKQRRNVVSVDGIQGLVDQQRISNRIMPVSILLDSRLRLVFKVDGVEVNNDRLAQRIVNKETGRTLHSFIGIDLGGRGAHTLSVAGMDPFGNARFKQELNIVLTGNIHKIRVVDSGNNIADGKTPVKVKLLLLDESGEAINAVNELKIDAGDLKPYRESGIIPDLRLRHGFVNVDKEGYAWFAPVTSSGLHRVTLSYNDEKQDIQVYVKPDYREWIMVGLVEGTAGYNNLSGNMQNLDDNDIDDKYYKDGRLAFYAKGKIKGKYLLTAAYDSAKEKPDEANGLFGTIDPDKYYTLYGDATTVRDDAPSTEKLYLRIESDNFYAMFGDYNTGLTVTELTRYSRNLTGLKTEYQDENIEISAFASQTGQAFIKDEIRGEGTSGLYHLSRQDIVLNSETIVIETRDRFRSEVTLSSRQLTRYIDYTFDPIDGTVYFREPIYSRDENFNPIYIVINYEVSSGASDAVTAGARLVARPSIADGVELGTTIIHEGTPGAEAELAGFDAKYAIDADTHVKAEIAISSKESISNVQMGTAMLAEVATKKNKLDGKVYLRRQEAGFGLGQQAGSETGTQKLGVDGKYHLSEKTSVNTEAFRQENIETDATRDIVNANVEYQQDVYSVSAGMRYANDKDGAGDSHQSTLVTGVARRSFMDKRLDVHASAEAPMANNENADYPQRLITGADYQLTSSTSLFAAQEVTVSDNQDSSTTRVGLKATPWKNALLNTSVEGQQSEAGERVFSNMGLTQGIQIDRHLRLDFGIERVVTLNHPGETPFNVNVPPASGTVSGDFTATSAGATYREKEWSLTSRAERRDGEQEDKLGLLVGFYRQQSAGFGLSVTLQHFDTKRVTNVDDTRTNLEFSLAFRPIRSQWIILNRTRFANDIAQTTTGETKTRKLINNINANYLYDRKNQISLMHGIKHVVDNFDGDEYSGLSNLFGVEYRHDLNQRWDVGAQTSMLLSNVGDSRRYSYGISIGHTLIKNLWISAGINIDGFADEDFSTASYTAAGAYLKFRFAFDQLTSREVMAWWEKTTH